MLGMRAALREEMGVLVAEADLQQQLMLPGQLPPPGEWPADMKELPVPPAVILPSGLCPCGNNFTAGWGGLGLRG